MKPVSKTILELYLNEAKALVEDGTVSGLVESVQKLFDEAIAEGEAVMAKEYATRDEVLQAAAKLMYAVQAQGMLAGDKTDLEMAIELAGMIDLTQYVEAGQAEFTAALAKANEVMEDGDAFQEDVDTAWNALTEAILNLRLKADKSVLEDLISQTAHLDLSSYTEESVVTFRAAFAAAKTVLLDEGLSVDNQAEVDEAVTALQAAYDGLEKVQAEPEDPDAENPDADRIQKIRMVTMRITRRTRTAREKRRIRVTPDREETAAQIRIMPQTPRTARTAAKAQRQRKLRRPETRHRSRRQV